VLVAILLFILGFALLLGGGYLLVQGASSLARTLGIPPLVIGLTVVSFGTSAPELAVNLTAVLSGKGGISFGNIVGSNIANIGLILGCAALLRPLAIEGTVISREIPMMLLASLAATVLAADRLLTGAATDILSRSDGLVLLLFFAVFLFYTVGEVVAKRRADPLVKMATDKAQGGSLRALTMDLLWLTGGLVALTVGGRLSVDGASRIAYLLGVPEVIIGLTIVAIGTSLPELVTSVLASWKGESEIAIGNVVGSNIFNLLFIGGLSAAAGTIPVPAEGLRDLAVMLLFSVILLPMAITNQRRITRLEGMLLLMLYAGYMVWLVIGSL